VHPILTPTNDPLASQLSPRNSGQGHAQNGENDPNCFADFFVAESQDAALPVAPEIPQGMVKTGREKGDNRQGDPTQTAEGSEETSKRDIQLPEVNSDRDQVAEETGAKRPDSARPKLVAPHDQAVTAAISSPDPASHQRQSIENSAPPQPRMATWHHQPQEPAALPAEPAAPRSKVISAERAVPPSLSGVIPTRFDGPQKQGAEMIPRAPDTAAALAQHPAQARPISSRLTSTWVPGYDAQGRRVAGEHGRPKAEGSVAHQVPTQPGQGTAHSGQLPVSDLPSTTHLLRGGGAAQMSASPQPATADDKGRIARVPSARLRDFADPAEATATAIRPVVALTRPLPVQAAAQNTAAAQIESAAIAAFDIEQLPSETALEPTRNLNNANSSAPTSFTMTRGDLHPAAARQIAEAMQNNPSRPIDITLSPEELGRVRLSLSTGDGSITVHVLAERADTLELMRRNIDQLGQEFLSLGYTDISFSFGSQDQDTKDGEGGSHQQSELEAVSIALSEPNEINLSLGQPDGLDLRL
jgi:hypothetical protein